MNAAEQLGLWDLEPTWTPPTPPPCAICGTPCLARVYAFIYGLDEDRPRKYIGAGPRSRSYACRTHLDDVTNQMRAVALEYGPIYLLVWSHVFQPGNPDSRLPGTPWSWHEVERIEP